MTVRQEYHWVVGIYDIEETDNPYMEDNSTIHILRSAIGEEPRQVFDEVFEVFAPSEIGCGLPGSTNGEAARKAVAKIAMIYGTDPIQVIATRMRLDSEKVLETAGRATLFVGEGFDDGVPHYVPIGDKRWLFFDVNPGLQCEECGNMYENLQTHLQANGMTLEEHNEKHGVDKTSLSERVRGVISRHYSAPTPDHELTI